MPSVALSNAPKGCCCRWHAGGGAVYLPCVCAWRRVNQGKYSESGPMRNARSQLNCHSLIGGFLFGSCASQKKNTNPRPESEDGDDYKDI